MTEPKGFMNKIGSRLSVQLIASFLIMFAIVVVMAFVALYLGIEKILATNAERNIIQRFKQCEYNINSFSADIDLVSRQLIMDSGLQSNIDYGNMSEADRVYYASQVIRQFMAVLSNYRFVDSVVYYGADGLIIKSSTKKNTIQYDEAAGDWFYQTSACQQVKENGQKLIWLGGYTDRDFSVASDALNSNTPAKFYLSAARGIFVNGRLGTLVLNIDMDYFTSIYNHSSDINEGTIYLIDNTGKIISSIDEAEIGKTSGVYRTMSGEAIQNLTLINADRKEQVILYRITGFNGILVSEIPFSIINIDVKILRYILVILFFISMVLAFLLSKFWINWLLHPLNSLAEAVKKIGQGNLGLTVENTPGNELGLLMRHFNRMSVNLKELFDRNESVEAEKRSLELDALRWQINPHFIYNTLNSIKWMAVINKADNIVESVTTLSDFLKPIFKNPDPLCTISDEISYIRNYIKIMNYRFAGLFEYRIDIPDEYMQLRIVRFMLQPIVENALVHGLIEQLKGSVSITAWSEDQDLWMQVEDNGRGISESALAEIRQALNMNPLPDRTEGSGIGLVNVNRRIKLQFGVKYGLEIESAVNQGTKVRLKMPIVR